MLWAMIKPPGRIEGGQVIVDDTDLTALSEPEMLKARLSKIAYIPQGAMNSLNPVMRIGTQMVDAIKAGSLGSFIPFDREGKPVQFEQTQRSIHKDSR